MNKKPRFGFGQTVYMLRFSAKEKPYISINELNVYHRCLIDNTFEYIATNHSPMKENDLFETKKDAFEYLKNLISELENEINEYVN